TESVRSATAKEIEFCVNLASPTQPEEPSFYLVPITGQIMPPSSHVFGKGGISLIDPRAVFTTTKPAVTPVPVSELKKRVFTADAANEAQKSAMARLPGPAKGIVGDGFVVVCSHCAIDLKFVSQCLSRFKKPLHGEFDMVMPSELVTVYIANDIRG